LIYVAASGQLIPKGRSTRASLGDALRMLDQPVESPHWAGAPHYRIRSDPARQAIVVEEDRDGDHVYERRRAFYRNRHGHWLEK
jgi:hypothetical protein